MLQCCFEEQREDRPETPERTVLSATACHHGVITRPRDHLRWRAAQVATVEKIRPASPYRVAHQLRLERTMNVRPPARSPHGAARPRQNPETRNRRPAESP